MKKLRRSSQYGYLGGVCEGFGEQFNISPTKKRVVLVALFIIGWFYPAVGFFAVLSYVCFWLFLPDDEGKTGLKEFQQRVDKIFKPEE